MTSTGGHRRCRDHFLGQQEYSRGTSFLLVHTKMKGRTVPADAYRGVLMRAIPVDQIRSVDEKETMTVS